MTARVPNFVESAEERASQTASGPATTGLAIVIITFNEGRNLLSLLESVRALAARLIVVDSGSSDEPATSRAVGYARERLSWHAAAARLFTLYERVSGRQAVSVFPKPTFEQTPQ
jgi:hypothetical protein